MMRIPPVRAPYENLSMADEVVVNAPRPPNLKALTSIRFFAALYVALYHMVRPFSRWGVFAGFFGAGYTAVSFFFLLSGFILTYSHASDSELGHHHPSRFWVARFARIYPVYLLSMIAALYLYSASLSKHIHVIAYVADLFMLQSWSIRMVTFFNVPAWSLSCEAFFYLVFPLAILRLRPASARRASVSFFLLWLLAMAVPLWMVCLYPAKAGAWHETSLAAGNFSIFRVRRLPLLALPEFLAGIPLAWMHLRFPLRRAQALAACILGIAGTLALLCYADHLPMAMLHNGLLLPFFALTVLGLSHDHLFTRILSIAPLVLLGEASYALYLTHFLFNDWVKTRFGLAEDFHGLFIRLMVLIPCCIALHLWVERPCRRFILHLWVRRHMAA